MKKGLFSKMAAAYTLIIAFSFIITATILSIWFQEYYFSQRKDQLLSESSFIEDAYLGYLSGDESLQSLNERLKYISKYLNADILVADNNGIIFAVSNNKQKSLIGNQILTKELKELKDKKVVQSSDRYTHIFKTPVYTLINPIHSEDVFTGAVIINTSIKGIKEPLKEVYMIIWFSAVLAIIGSCIIIYYFSQKIIIKPLSEINCAARKISQGKVDKRVPVHSDDEIGTLAKSFNSMADSLEQVENNRREFISNVSHELRSPITSIKGFISGILDGVIPEEKEDYYLAIAYEEIQRLTRLINDLLDLSAIESNELNMNIKEIDLNEIIRIIVIKFEPDIKAKKIKVDVCFDEDGDDVYVAFDNDRLIQVITNLIDNAIKYVDEGGNIKIYTNIRGAKVYVSIFNDGVSISQEDIKHVWDRFYRADKARTSKESTGLGLSIVRSILSQLGEDIWVESKEGEGVTFTFSLRRVYC